MSYGPEHLWYLERVGIRELPHFLLQNAKVSSLASVYFYILDSSLTGDCYVGSNFDHKRCLFFICALYLTGSEPYLFLSTICRGFWNFNTYFDIFLITYLVKRSGSGTIVPVPDPEPLFRFRIWPGQ
jgi:hypothetical protein